ncbi:MAG: hypothetical protein ABIH00_04945 [Armatimonadota bacterium]
MTRELRHLDPCPKCDNKLYMSVKVYDSLIKDLEDKDEPGTIYFSCSGTTSHCFKLKPTGRLIRLPDVIIKTPRKKAAKKDKKKKETRKIRKIKVVKKKTEADKKK